MGCGWLGMPLAQSLVQAGYHVKGSTTSKDKVSAIRSIGAEPYHVTLDPEYPEAAVEFLDAEILIVNIPPRNKDGEDGYHLSQLTSLRQQAENRGVKFVVFVSSTGVYANVNRVVTEGDASPELRSRGGVHLLAAEGVFSGSDTLRTTVLRFGGLYGGDRHPGRFLAGKSNLAGAESPINMIHLDDCIGVIHHVIKQDAWGEIFNACAPSHPTRKDFYDLAAKALNMSPPQFNGERKDFKIVSSQKLISHLIYSFKVLPEPVTA